MGRKLRYLGPSERAEIERLHNGGAPAAVISEKVGSHVATIYRELPNGYTGTVDEYGVAARGHKYRVSIIFFEVVFERRQDSFKCQHRTFLLFVAGLLGRLS